MKIIKMKTNHIYNPLGFALEKATISYVVTDTKSKRYENSKIEVALDQEFDNIVYNSGLRSDIDSLAFEIPIKLNPCTRYYWRVSVWGDNGEIGESDIAWFETGKMDEKWQGIWIAPTVDKDIHPVMTKSFNIDKKVKSASAYICGLGLYELEINNVKVGQEYLTPYCNAYDKWLQYQSYDITDSLIDGENNIEVLLGNGWYKGRFGFDGGATEIYGQEFALICEIKITFEDGSNIIVPSDLSWKSKKSKIKFSGIYDGEVYDSTFVSNEIYDVKEINLGMDRLKERLSLPVVIKERIKPVEVINTPSGETVLDFGQVITGWLEFNSRLEKGVEVLLQYGEVLQEGNFYRENLRTAKAEYKYIASGKDEIVRPRFTFYGFRYVKLTGWTTEINIEDFIGCVLYSDMETTGHIETSNPLVNKLFLNALWGQKGNFLDVPTDCPQRDERMGWTGDAQVFSGTAAFNMDTYAFFNKFCYDMGMEQSKRDGMVPMVVPAISVFPGRSSAWGDAATIIPWNMYLFYGDKTILENNFNNMKSWVDYIKKEDEANGGNRLWDSGFHFGDWLALDGEDPNAPLGGTEEFFIASAYYYYSSSIVAKAAKVIGKLDLAKEYEVLADEIKEAIIDEYFTKTGRLSLKNQTAYIIALFMGLLREEDRKRVAEDLNTRIHKDKGYLKTGFVGTPYICRVLSESGYNEMAYKLLLNKDYPSWLYPVTMGATTIWERWNSILPDGKISGTDMNSLNHYAYGSIAEWMYRNMAGINPVKEVPGFRKARLQPQPDYRFKFVKATFNSPVGEYRSEWSINEDGSLSFNFTVPFNAIAEVILPNLDIDSLYINDVLFKDSGLIEKDGIINIDAGKWEFKYIPIVPYIKYYNTDMSLADLLANKEVEEILREELKTINEMPQGFIKNIGNQSINELVHMPFFQATQDEINRVNSLINKIKVEV